LDTVVECTNARPQWAVILAIHPARNMADPKQAALGARAASRSLQARTSEQRAQVLQRMASALEVSSSDITDANARDVSDAKAQGTLISSLLSEHSERIYPSVTAVVHILVQLRTQGWQHRC
jgi:gamma-glutamyl phosphate reductase